MTKSLSLLDRATEAARKGRLEEAERLARRDGSPNAYLLLSMAAESRGELHEALDHARTAASRNPSLAAAHAFLVPLYMRLGMHEESELARRSALEALSGMDDDELVSDIEMLSAGALRRALDPRSRG